jgi:hypothetical protein
MHTLLFAHFDGIADSPRFSTLYEAMSRLPIEEYVAVSLHMGGYTKREICPYLRCDWRTYTRHRNEGLQRLRDIL